MRSFTRLLLLIALLLPFSLWANVYLHGTIKRTDGTPVPNYPVYIFADSIGGSCPVAHIRYTNQNGLYGDTLICNTIISKVVITVDSCNGISVRHEHIVSATQTVESDFIICIPAIPCQPNFTWERIAGTNRIQFNSTSSSSAPGDTIISRKWRFGDGDSLTGNVVSPEHTYALPGSYQVCLIIKTSGGCEKITCKTIILQNPATACNANFTYHSIGTFSYIFYGGYSTVVSGDSVLLRQWNFGDGTTATGLNPIHGFTTPGTYVVCLTIQTASGCNDSSCTTVIVLPPPPPHCKALFYTDSVAVPAGANPALFHRKFISTASHGAPASDSIISRKWTFGDSSSITTGNQVNPIHGYAQTGYYTVCLYLETASGCRDTICNYIYIAAPTVPHCEANFSSERINTPSGSNPALRYFRFHSANSHGAPASDSIVSRTWNFGDSTALLQGNQVTPVHGYAHSGWYDVCLYIQTASGCRDTACGMIVITPPPIICQPRFTTAANGLAVTFNSSATSIAAGDSIISRSWTFGDGTGAGNAVVLTHQYAQVGEYQICLTIRTKMGCTTTWCKKIPVINQPGNCVPYFTKGQPPTPLRSIRFNSTAAYSQFPNDSVIERKWDFGDGQTLTGNVINPLHTYANGGTYTVCLKIRTARCDARWCQSVLVRPVDSTNSADSINIVNLYPVPVTTQLNAVVFSSSGNVTAELSIYDVYGVKKWAQSKILPQGNSTHNVATSQLANGPYIFRVTTMHGIKSRNFYKLN